MKASKLNESFFLSALIDKSKNIDFASVLYGYTLSKLKFPFNLPGLDRLYDTFFYIKQLTWDRTLSKQNAVMLILDSIDGVQYIDNNSKKLEQFSNLINYGISELLIDKDYIKQKWNRKQAIELQNLKNQQMIRKMIQDQQTQSRQKKMKKEQQNQKNQEMIRKMIQDQKKQCRDKRMKQEQQGWSCQVCYTQMQIGEYGVLECQHLFHRECLKQCFKAQIQTGQTQLRCPMEQCKRLLPVSDIYKFIDGALKQKFDSFCFNKCIEDDPCLSWCPTAGCSAVFEFDEALDNYRCPTCKKHYCLKCRCLYHSGMTCKQYQINNHFGEADKKFQDFVKGAKFKQCPKCNYWVERNSGCCTMTCKCGQQFCYTCGGSGCPHGSCSNSGNKK